MKSGMVDGETMGDICWHWDRMGEGKTISISTYRFKPMAQEPALHTQSQCLTQEDSRIKGRI